MNIFIWEYICGGGMLGEQLPAGFVAQGGAMLAAVCADFVEAGHRVTTLLDPRVTLPMQQVDVTPAQDSVDALFDRLAVNADAALIIAPEFNGILEHRLIHLEKLGVRNLGCDSTAARLCGDKLALGQHLLSHQIVTPPLLARPSAFPCIVKPRYGVGCENTYLCRNEDEVRRLPHGEERIVQPYVSGTPASISLIVHDRCAMALPTGRQNIAIDANSPAQLHYQGGSMPLPPHLQHRAAAIGLRAARTIPGLSGFIGIDIVLGEQERDDAVIEINPRLTLSYVGLKHLCQTILAAAMLDPDAPLKWRDAVIRFDTAGRIEEAVQV